MSGLSIGDRVDTKVFGPGVVRSIEGRSARVLIDRFGSEVEVLIRDLTQIFGRSAGPSPPRPAGGGAERIQSPVPGTRASDAPRAGDWIPTPGASVLTRVFGEGVLVEIQAEWGIVRVGAGGAMKVRQHLSELRPVSAGSTGPVRVGDSQGTLVPRAVGGDQGGIAGLPPGRTPKPIPALGSPENLRQSVEALRFGLVPAEKLSELTIGYPGLQKWTLSRLPHEHGGEPQISEISGPFGTGKSHAAAVVRHVAREENYLTAHVEVDGRIVSLSDPERLLGVLWSNLVIPGHSSATPVLDIYLKAMAKSIVLPSVVPSGINRVGDNFSSLLSLKRLGLLDAHAEALDGILSSTGEYTAIEVAKQLARDSGYSTAYFSLRPMIGRLVDDRPYDFIESIAGMAALAKQAGFQGLVVTIDELEVEWALLAPEKIMRALSLLSALGKYLQGKTRHRHVPLALFVATVGQQGEAGDPQVTPLLQGHPDERRAIRPLGKNDRGRLAGKIHELYCEAYGIEVEWDPEVVNWVEAGLQRRGFATSEVVREFVKLYTSTLDSLYGPPNGTIPT